ncbi:MAG: endolytic transglycosylase MltG [Synergistaceae bacterium]|nr:endolytic transglycosylase MltG [Synergistaceae bacterium]
MKKRLILALLLILGAGASWFAYRTVYLPASWWHEYLPRGSGEPVPVLVRSGISAAEAAKAFEAAGVLKGGGARHLARWMTRFGIDRRLKPGLYRIKPGSPWEAARQLERAEPSVASVTIVPGTDIFSFPGLFSPALTSEETEVLLSEDGLFPKELRDFLPGSSEGRLAFLLPETVHVAELTGKETVEAASRLWWERVGRHIEEEKRTAEFLLETAVEASLIEREVLWDSERPLVAGVIKNRREKKMPLQIDATVVYAWKKEGKDLKRVLYKDLEIDSPYNTYKIPGIPPAPICIPSEKSWLAALEPDDTDYLYYVADKDGRHLFSETFKGHQKNIRKARSK